MSWHDSRDAGGNQHRLETAGCCAALAELAPECVPPLDIRLATYYGWCSPEHGKVLEHWLCEQLSGMTVAARDHTLYSDARDRRRRRLAQWWEDHGRVDATNSQPGPHA